MNEPQEEGGGFSVTVADNGDGTYSITSSDQDASEGEDAGPQTAKSMDEACQMMAQMFQEESGEEQQEPDDGADLNEKLPADKAQAVWSQMAGKKKAM